MSQAAKLAQRVIVLHREPGYLRLELPAELCTPAASAAIEQGMTSLAGINIAVIDRGWLRISIRFDQTVCSTAQVARRLFGLFDSLPAPSAETEVTAAEPEQTTNGLQPLLDKFKAVLTPAVEAPAGSLQAKIQPILASAFYLIKAHWDLITKRWLQQPLAHSNAWMTTFYLVFLLVRYRKTNLKK